jgi:hypothetical protein
MSNDSLHQFPDLFRQQGNLDPKVAAHMLLRTHENGARAVQGCLAYAGEAARGADWFAVRYWVKAFDHLDALVLPPLLMEDFEPLDPPPLDKGDGDLGREW